MTTNQALIVALGRSFDDRTTTVQVSETSVEAQHVQPGSPCYACHQVLDPMRDFFKQSYSLTYFQQLDLMNRRNPIPATGHLQRRQTPAVTGSGVPAFAKAMAEHPRFPMAWAGKLCQYANSSECPEDDPELQRVAGQVPGQQLRLLHPGARGVLVAAGDVHRDRPRPPRTAG